MFLGLLAVPSFSTLQTLRKSIIESGNTCPLTQKHLVQLDWVSKEDGAHILTVAVGSRVSTFVISVDVYKIIKNCINIVFCCFYIRVFVIIFDNYNTAFSLTDYIINLRIQRYCSS